MSQRKRTHHREPIGPVPFLVVLLVVLTALGSGAVLYFGRAARPVASDPGVPGRLVASQPAIDLGRVPFDQPAEARFELTNTGADTVRLVGAPRVRMLEGC